MPIFQKGKQSGWLTKDQTIMVRHFDHKKIQSVLGVSSKERYQLQKDFLVGLFLEEVNFQLGWLFPKEGASMIEWVQRFYKNPDFKVTIKTLLSAGCIPALVANYQSNSVVFPLIPHRIFPGIEWETSSIDSKYYKVIQPKTEPFPSNSGVDYQHQQKKWEFQILVADTPLKQSHTVSVYT